MTSPPARFEATVHVTRAVVVLTAILVIVLCLLWTAQRPATPEPLTVAWRDLERVDSV